MGTDKAGTVVGTASGLEASGLETSGLEARGLTSSLSSAGDPVGQQVVSEPRTSAVVILTDGDDRRFGVGRRQWHCHSCPATTGGSCPHGVGGQRHHLTDADSH